MSSAAVVIDAFRVISDQLYSDKPKISYRYLKLGTCIQELHGYYVLVPADKAANNFVVV